MKMIINIFEETFDPWDIRLPPLHVDERMSGKIVQAGWAIWYCFGRDERGEFMDYYASHRMTDDRHVRIYEDGTVANLPALSSFGRYSADPQENERLQAEEREQRLGIEKMLEAKGFGLAGDEPGGVAMNRLLRSGRYDANATEGS